MKAKLNTSYRSITRKLSKKQPQQFTLQDVYTQGYLDAYKSVLAIDIDESLAGLILANLTKVKEQLC